MRTSLFVSYFSLSFLVPLLRKQYLPTLQSRQWLCCCKARMSESLTPAQKTRTVQEGMQMQVSGPALAVSNLHNETKPDITEQYLQQKETKSLRVELFLSRFWSQFAAPRRGSLPAYWSYRPSLKSYYHERIQRIPCRQDPSQLRSLV